MHTGADDYIAKPFHPALLKARIAAMIESQRRFIEKLKQDGGIIVPKDIAKNPLDEQFLQKVLNIVKLNMDKEEFSVEELGDAMAMSRSNLFRKMKALTGQTPIEFIYYIRMKHAMELLLERKMSISEISSEVGFKNHSSFTKSFKKQFGKSPSEYLNDVIKK
jgi:AraC-like DNA-binding protein